MYSVTRQNPGETSTSPPLKVREADEEDVAAIVSLLDELEHPTEEPVVRERVSQPDKRPSHLILVAERGSEVIGVVSAHVVSALFEHPRAARLSALCVAEKHRGEGIGRRLVRTVERWAEQQNCDIVEVTSHKRRNRAHGFYESLGYADTHVYFEKGLNGPGKSPPGMSNSTRREDGRKEWRKVSEAGLDDVRLELGLGPAVHPTAVIEASQLGSWTEIGAYTRVKESQVGDYSYIADAWSSVIYTTIGKFCSIASHVRINPGNHPMDRVSQHHFTYRRKQYGFDTQNEKGFFDWRRRNRCELGHDVWVGHGATIMPGVSVGTGSVIGAGSVVTRDVAPYQVVAGVPARPIRPRFPEGTSRALMKTEWWNWDHETLQERFDDFLDLDTFLEKYT